jgi:hypothetical protein
VGTPGEIVAGLEAFTDRRRHATLGPGWRDGVGSRLLRRAVTEVRRRRGLRSSGAAGEKIQAVSRVRCAHKMLVY